MNPNEQVNPAVTPAVELFVLKKIDAYHKDNKAEATAFRDEVRQEMKDMREGFIMAHSSIEAKIDKIGNKVFWITGVIAATGIIVEYVLKK